MSIMRNITSVIFPVITQLGNYFRWAWHMSGLAYSGLGSERSGLKCTKM